MYCRFIKLPVWIKIILTGRPQTEAYFAAWKPDWIEPSSEDNWADMRTLLKSKLQERTLVADKDSVEAVQVMLDKSEVGLRL